MADLMKLKGFMDAYGVAVRAGVITPNPEDESYIRGIFGLPAITADVLADWKRTNNVRVPLTLVQAAAVSEDIESDPNSNGVSNEASQV